jgi:hypothetical protein
MTEPEHDVDAPSAPEGDASPPSRRPVWATVGALVFVVIGLAMLVPAVHTATAPVLLPTASGPPFDCGTAVQPPTKPFPVRVCGAQTRLAQQQAVAWGVAAVIVGVGGPVAFLVPTRGRRPRRARRHGAEGAAPTT